jgi:hypothetical protein
MKTENGSQLQRLNNIYIIYILYYDFLFYVCYMYIFHNSIFKQSEINLSLRHNVLYILLGLLYKLIVHRYICIVIYQLLAFSHYLGNVAKNIYI